MKPKKPEEDARSAAELGEESRTAPTERPPLPSADDARQAADLAESDRAASADGLPLPPDDAETRFTRDAGEPEEAATETDFEEKDLAAEILSERGAD